MCKSGLLVQIHLCTIPRFSTIIKVTKNIYPMALPRLCPKLLLALQT